MLARQSSSSLDPAPSAPPNLRTSRRACSSANLAIRTCLPEPRQPPIRMATQSFPQNMFMKINKLDEFGATPKNSQAIEF